MTSIHTSNTLSIGINEATRGTAADTVGKNEIRPASSAGIGSSTSGTVLRALSTESDGGSSEIVSSRTVARSVIVGSSGNHTLTASCSIGADSTSTRTGSTDTVQIKESLHAETLLRGKHESSVGVGHTTNTDGVGVDSQAVRTVGISTAAGLNTSTVGVLRKSGQAVADLVSR